MCWLIAFLIIIALIGLAIYFGGDEAITVIVAGIVTIAMALFCIVISCIPYIVLAFIVILMLMGFGVI